ncbi:MAG: translocation/assembly module TamB domain-containing protein [Polyangiaceae bacterium]|nr:translocation/assembly module TamB domain-containing protein [Polyangiaceae bacterium]
MTQPDDESDDVELPLIPRPPRAPSIDADGGRPEEPAYSLRPPAPPKPPADEPAYSLRPPPVARTETPAAYSLRPPGPPSAGPITVRPPSSDTPSSPVGVSGSPSARPRAAGRTSSPPSSRPSRGRFGRAVAMTFCILFAVIGFVPVFAVVLVRLPSVQAWAARETAAILERELGARATYDVRVRPWPLTLGVDNLVIDGDDGKGPFLTVESASLRPRLFSLLAGKVDVGEVEVTGAHARVVVRDGELVSFKPKTPEKKAESEEPAKSPFRALALTDATVDLDVDGTLLFLTEVDLDVIAERDGSFELAVRAGGGTLSRSHADLWYPGEEVADEDRLCHFEARARLDADQESVLIRRLGLGAVVDLDPDLGTRPACDVPDEDWRKVAVRLGAVELPIAAFEGKDLALISGRAELTVPLALAHRLVSIPHVTGRARVDVEATRAPGADAPIVTGSLHTDFPGLDGRVFSDRVDTRVTFDGSVLNADDVRARWADGDFVIRSATLDLDALTLDAREISADHVSMQGLLRDLGVHPQSHVGWGIDRVEFDSFGGTLDPLDISGKLSAKTTHFGVYDRPSHKPEKLPLVHVDRGDIKGTLAIRHNAVVFEKMHLVMPRSSIFTTVSLGFSEEFGLEVAPGSYLDLSEISPLSAVQIGGKTKITARGGGTTNEPRIEGDLEIEGFELGGFKAGDIRTAHAVFVPLSLELSRVELWKSQSFVTSAKTVVAFDRGPDVLVDADLLTTQAPHLKLADFFEVFELDQDPRFKQLTGTAIGAAKVHYVVGGAEDRCGGGLIDVRTKMQLDRPELFGEAFERGSIDVHYKWDDSAAGAEGMEIDIASATIQDGTGSITAQAEVRHGGVLRGTAVIGGMPLSKLEAFGSLRDYLDGELSGIATLGGTLARMSADLDVSITPLRFGANKLPSSRLSIHLEPDPIAPPVVGRSACDLPISPPRDPQAALKDLPDGTYHVNGQLFDGQVVLDDLTVTNQSNKLIGGKISLRSLDVGTLASALPLYALGAQAPKARLSADIDLTRLESANLPATQASIILHGIEASQGGRTVKLVRADLPISVLGGDIVVPELGLAVSDDGGLSLGFTAAGKVLDVFEARPRLDASLAIAPFDLSTLRDDLPSVDRLAGTLSGSVEITGDASAPKVTGFAKLREGALALTGVDATLDQVAVDIALGDGEIRVTKATANVGAGTVDVTGRIPIVGLGYGTGSAAITVRGVKLPIGEGIDVLSDADLDLTIPASDRPDATLPELRGTVNVTSFLYKRPIALSLDLGELSRSIGRSDVEAYDPQGDFLKFALKIVSSRPLVVRNDLADVRLEIVEPGLELSGTNQRYGAKGSLRVLQDSKIRLRNHEFDVSEGYVRFNDPTKVKAEIDLQATTDMRRYAQAESAADSSAGAATAGEWNVNVHAHGSTEDLKLDLSSDPPLDQEDIVLLLTVGMTRAEIDRGLATSLGETVGLEALSALTGADKAVKSVVPIIDYFHFGSSYSARTGRTEPNVTVGKRLTDDVRASVTTTLTERDVAATVEWRLKKGVSIQASYDNTNDIGTIIGNLGADLRWRLEFE